MIFRSIAETRIKMKMVKHKILIKSTKYYRSPVGTASPYVVNTVHNRIHTRICAGKQEQALLYNLIDFFGIIRIYPVPEKE